MHTSTILISLMSAASAMAMPYGGGGWRKPQTYPVSLPPSTLPPPADNLELKFVVLGYGTQNYTCANTPNASTPPVGNGAVADLFNVKPLLSLLSGDRQTQLAKALPILALQIGSRTNTPGQLPGFLEAKQIGKHFFATGGIPTFNLYNASPAAQISAKKAANVPAPADAYAGLNGEGAVDWLQLIDNGLGATTSDLVGGDVYRVETAGGKAPTTCAGQSGDVLVKYSTLYFIYGPK